jgi:hypothetical protein
MLYDNETFRVYVIRRGWDFWTGKTFKTSPYNAKCFPTVKEAQECIDRNKMQPDGNDKPFIQEASLTVHPVQAEQPCKKPGSSA